MEIQFLVLLNIMCIEAGNWAKYVILTTLLKLQHSNLQQQVGANVGLHNLA